MANPQVGRVRAHTFKNHYLQQTWMAKDPAFLFYSSDFLIGTSLFSEKEVGQYTRIICHLHQSGHLSLDEIKTLSPKITDRVLAKFKQDGDGKFYNERLEVEVSKRKKYSESRRNNRLKSKSYDTTYDKSYVRHMENENENTGINKKESPKILPFDRSDYYQSGSEAFEEVKQDEQMVELMLRAVRRSGFPACTDMVLMGAVRHFITVEEAKPNFDTRPKDDLKKHLVNWVTLKAKTLNQYA